MKTTKHNDKIETRNDEGEYHSFNDKPAIVYNNGNKFWFKKGRIRRENAPAIKSIGGRWWYKEGKLHRIDGPAIEYISGFEYWYYEGKEIECSSLEEFLKIINLKAFW